MPPKTVVLRVRRQAGPHEKAYWEEFEVPYRSQLNVIACLLDIQRNPVNRLGQPTTAPAWDASCLEEVCGACTMIVNGEARQACSALIDELEQPVVLQPLTKFPLVKDLAVDRSKIFEDLKRAKAWIELDGTFPQGPGPRTSPAMQQLRYTLSRCMSCGCCMEVCPQYDTSRSFVGAAVLSQVRLFNLHPTGRTQAEARHEAVSGPGGIADCGNAQNCVRACPKEIPLTESIAALGGEMVIHGLRKFFVRH